MSDKETTLAALALSHSVSMIAEAYADYEQSGNPWNLAETVKDALDHAAKYLEVWGER